MPRELAVKPVIGEPVANVMCHSNCPPMISYALYMWQKPANDKRTSDDMRISDDMRTSCDKRTYNRKKTSNDILRLTHKNQNG